MLLFFGIFILLRDRFDQFSYDSGYVLEDGENQTL